MTAARDDNREGRVQDGVWEERGKNGGTRALTRTATRSARLGDRARSHDRYCCDYSVTVCLHISRHSTTANRTEPQMRPNTVLDVRRIWMFSMFYFFTKPKFAKKKYRFTHSLTLTKKKIRSSSSLLPPAIGSFISIYYDTYLTRLQKTNK